MSHHEPIKSAPNTSFEERAKKAAERKKLNPLVKGEGDKRVLNNMISSYNPDGFFNAVAQRSPEEHAKLVEIRGKMDALEFEKDRRAENLILFKRTSPTKNDFVNGLINIPHAIERWTADAAVFLIDQFKGDKKKLDPTSTQEYKDLAEQKRQILIQPSTEQYNIVKKQRIKAEKAVEDITNGDFSNSLNVMKAKAAAAKLRAQEGRLKDYIEGKDSFFSEMYNSRRELAGFTATSIVDGLATLHTGWKYKNKKEEINEYDEALAQALHFENIIQEAGLMDGRTHARIGGGFVSSVSIIPGLFIGGGAGAFAKGAATKLVMPTYRYLTARALLSSTGQASRMNKIFVTAGVGALDSSKFLLTEGAGAAVTGSLNAPFVAKTAAEKYTENSAEITINGETKYVLGDEAVYEKIKEVLIAKTELDTAEKEIRDKKVPTAEDKKNLEKIRGYKLQLESATNNLLAVKDPNLASAIMYAEVESFKETFSELAGGKMLENAFTPLSAYLGNKSPRFKRFQTGYKETIQGAQDFMGDTRVGLLARKLNYATGVNRVFHGIPEEIGEELIVQFLPSYSHNWKESYKEQMMELGKAQFWTDTVFTTALMGLGVSGLGTINNMYNFKRTKERGKLLEEARTFYKNLNKVVNDEELADYIVMNTAGTLTDMAMHDMKVQQLLNAGKKEEATALQKKGLINRVLYAFQTGTLEDLKTSLGKLETQAGIGIETKVNIQKAYEFMDVLSKVKEDHGDKVNFDSILELSFFDKYLKDATLEADVKYNQKFSSLANNFELEEISPDYMSLLDSFFNGRDLTEDEYKVITNLQAIQDPALMEVFDAAVAKHQAYNIAADNSRRLKYNIDPKNKAEIEKKYEEDTKKRFLKEIKESSNKEDLVKYAESKDPEVSKVAKQKLADIQIKETRTIIPENELDSNGEEITDDEKILYEDVAEEIEEETLPEGLDEIEPEEFLSPQGMKEGADFSAAREKIQKIVRDLSAELGRPITPADYLNRFKKILGTERAEKLFNGLVKGFEDATGITIADSKKLYDEVFGTLEQAIEDVAGITSEQLIEEKTDALEKQKQIETGKLLDYDPNTKVQAVEIQPTPFDEDRRTTSPDLKFAYSYLTGVRLSDTTWRVEERDLREGLIPLEDGSFLVNNHYILDPDFLYRLHRDKVELTVIPIDDNDILVPELMEDGEIRNIKWGLFKAKHGLDNLDTEEKKTLYANKVPMAVGYEDKGKMTFISPIHDQLWYRPKNINSNTDQEAVAKEGAEKIISLRQNVMKGNNKIIITSTHFGNIDKLNQHKDKTPVTINEATGDSTLAIVVKENGVLVLQTSPGVAFKKNISLSGTDEKGNPRYKEGMVVDIRPVHKDAKGEDEYMAFHTMTDSPAAEGNLKRDLDPKIFNTIKFGVLTSTILNNLENKELLDAIEKKYDFTLLDARRMQNVYLDSVGINLDKNISGFLGLFVRLNDKATPNLLSITNKYIDKQGKEGTSSYAFQYAMHGTGQYKSIGGKLNNSSVGNTLNNLEELFNDQNGLFKKTKFNTNFRYLHESNTVSLMTEKGQPTSSQSYSNLVKNTLKTNILSHKITGQDQKEKWITDVQPMIYYEQSVKSSKKKPDAIDNAKKAASEMTKNKKEEVQEKPKSIFDMLNLTPEQQARLDSLKGPEDFESRHNRTKEVLDNIYGLKSNKIDGLTVAQNNEVVSVLKHQILSALVNVDKVSMTELKGLIEGSVETYFRHLLDSDKALLENVESVLQKYAASPQDNIRLENLRARIAQLESIIAQQHKLTSFSKKKPGSLTKEFNVLFTTNIEEDRDELEDNTKEKGYSQSALEIELKSNYHNRLKIALFGIVKKNNNGHPIENFLGIDSYYSADEIFNEILDIAANGKSDIEYILNALETKYKSRKKYLYKQIKEKVDGLSKQVQFELLHKSTTSRATYLKVLINKTDDGDVVRVLDENSSKADLALKNTIKRDFISSQFSSLDGQKLIFNKEYAKNVLAIVKKAFDNKGEVTFETVRELFDLLGLERIQDNTIKKYMETINPLDPADKGIIVYLKAKLEKLIDTKDKVDISLDKNNIFENAGGALKKLVDLEILLNGTPMVRSVRIAGKMMQGTVPTTSMHDTIYDICDVENSELYKAMKNDPLTKNNFLLGALQDSNFNNEFDIAYSSPDSYGEENRKSVGDKDFDKTSLGDNLSTVLGLFTHTRGFTNLNQENLGYPGLKFRIGRMPIQSIADKGRMVYVTVPILSLSNNISTDTAGNIGLNDSVLNFLTEQIFMPEINRIIGAYKNPDPSLLNYNEAAKIFSTLGSFNSIEYGGLNIHHYLSQNGIENNEDFINAVKQAAKEKILNYINSETDKKLNIEGTTGEFIDTNIFSIGEKGQKVQGIDTAYLHGMPGEDPLNKLRALGAEFIINNLLNLNNINHVFLGDTSFYSKDSSIKSKVFTDGKVDPAKISDPKVYANVLTEMASIMNKRVASLIAPGNILAMADSRTEVRNEFLHLAINDVRSASSDILGIIKNTYDNLTEEQTKKVKELEGLLKKLKDLDKKDPLYQQKNEVINEKIAKLGEDYFPIISSYFDITGTDAQEYTTWRGHLDTLFRQGNLSEEQRQKLEDIYTKLSEGVEDLTQEEIGTFFQPVKPVYSGLVPYNGRIRPVYIKSSSFPLLPQLTKNLDIDSMRKTMERVEGQSKRILRVSYQTANKIGALNTKITTHDLYTKSLEELQTSGLLESGLSVLPTRHFRIQQETPSKEDKAFHKGEDAHSSLGSQIFKIITSNGINKITDKIFPNYFSNEILSKFGVKAVDGKISGEDLDKLDFSVYEEYSNLQKELLYNKIGFPKNTNFETLSKKQQNRILEKLNDLLREEITSRNYPLYFADSINLIEEQGQLVSEIPLMLNSNSYKLEALLQSIISRKLISHKLPGNSHIVGSSEGFVKSANLEIITNRKGIVWLEERDELELKSTIVDGKVTASEVLIKSHYKIRKPDGTFDYINLNSDEYSSDIIVDGKVVGRKLNLEKISPEILEMFSFRIPTSSHQSGVMLKVVGFLPSESQDLVIVPKEHTIQLGEDYDIDKRYVYKSNYFVDSTGMIKKLQYTDDIGGLINTINEIFGEENASLDKIVSSLVYQNSDMLAREVDTVRQELKDLEIQENEEGILIFKEKLLNNLKIKMLENAMIDVYKSVYSTPNLTVQRKIFKPLETKVANATANLMEATLKEDLNNTNFSFYSDSYQRYLLKMGADGKSGIAIHSNAVTLEGQFQRLPEQDKIRIIDSYDEDGNPIWYNETIGDLYFDGYLGQRTKTLDGGREISDQHGENQNISTDNVSKMIMGKRNENTYTMSVYAMMSHMGFDSSLDTLAETGKKIHIPSVFINQPILRDYVALQEEYNSINSAYSADKEADIITRLAKKYGFEVPAITELNPLSFIKTSTYIIKSNEMTGQNLFHTLKEDKALNEGAFQAAVLQKFLRIRAKALELSQYQQLINLSSSKLGVSYFEVLQRVEMMNKLALNNSFSNLSRLVGKSHYAVGLSEESHLYLLNEGYTLIGDYYWKATTKEGVMLINALSTANDVLPIHFPYNSPSFKYILENIFAIKGEDINKKASYILEMKYDAMEGFNNFIFTSVGLTAANTSRIRKKLFESSTKNMSLAKIIQDLQIKKHPIMENSLLKDLTPQLNPKASGIDVIRHTSNEMTLFDSTSKYDAFNELLQSEEVIGEYNGEQYTTSMLAEDLATYAYLANNEKGATGFKNFISIDYLKIFGISSRLRERYKEILEVPDKAFLDTFIRQYIQHNPELAPTVTKNSLMGFKGNLDQLRVTDIIHSTNEMPPAYVSFRNNGITTTNKKYTLFEHQGDGIYKKIDVLGTSGFNEFDPEVYEQKSILNGVKPTPFKFIEQGGQVYYFDKTTKKHHKYAPIEKYYPAEKGVDGILQTMFDSEHTSAQYKEFISALQKYVDLDVEIRYEDIGEEFGKYRPEEHVIILNKNLLKLAIEKTDGDFRKASEIVKEVIFEEILHSMTVKEFRKYVLSEENGDIVLKPDAPLFATKLVALYKVAKENIPYNPKDISTYYSKNIYEFMAGVFASEDYREKLERNSKGFLAAFRQLLKNLFGIIYKQKTGKTLSYKEEVFNAVEDLLKVSTHKGFELKESNKGIIEELKKDMGDPLDTERNKRPIEKVEEKGEEPSEIEITMENLTENINTLLEEDKILAKEIYDFLGITFTNDENLPCAVKGMTNATQGTGWQIVKDFKGKPKHSQGGVDITLSDKGVSMKRGDTDIKAAFGLIIPNSN